MDIYKETHKSGIEFVNARICYNSFGDSTLRIRVNVSP